MRSIAVIGAGAAGRTFALRCAQAGFVVALEDVMPEKLRRAQDEYAELQSSGSVGSLRYALTVEDAVNDADIAVDFVPDELESKLEIFSLLDRMAPPRTILCTPTMALSITDLASCTYRPSLCIALQGSTLFLGDLKIVRSRFTAPGVIEAIESLLQSIGCNTVVVDDDLEPMLVKNL